MSSSAQAFANKERFPTARLLRVVTIVFSLLLAITAAGLPFVLMSELEEAFRWAKLFLVASLVFLGGTVWRSDLVAFWRRLQCLPALSRRWHWFQFCAATLALVFLIEAVSIASYGRFPILPSAGGIVLNALVVVFLTGFVFAATNRFAFSVGLIYSAYLIACVANILKVQYLRTAIRPLDVHYLLAFNEFAEAFFGKTAIIISIAAAIAWIAFLAFLWRKTIGRAGVGGRLALAAISCVGLVGLGVGHKIPAVSKALKCCNLHKNLSNGTYCAERRGFLLEFVSDIYDSIPRTPANYTEDNVRRAFAEHCQPRGATAAPAVAAGDANIIVFLIESFMDPMDLKLKFTSDPIPNFRAAAQNNASGYAIVPNEFFGSTNTEFEILTGMSCRFLPKGSCAYVQYVKRDIPSLFTFLTKRGYQTFTIHGGPPCLYDRVPVYGHMHVGEMVWLTKLMREQGGVAADVAGRYPSDESLADAVIDISRKHRRFFVYASSNATHGPFDYDAYDASDLDVDEPMGESARKELKVYINAIRTADAAVGKLLKYFQNSSEKTIIVVLGDHWPPFCNAAEIYAKTDAMEEPTPSALPSRRRIPLLIWTNFDPQCEKIARSTNFLAMEMLSRAGITPDGLLALNDALRRQFSVFSCNYLRTIDGKRVEEEELSPASSHLVEDYRLLQYDLLMGKQYSAAP